MPPNSLFRTNLEFNHFSFNRIAGIIIGYTSLKPKRLAPKIPPNSLFWSNLRFNPLVFNRIEEMIKGIYR
jgi:hypothetical protein